MIQLIVLLTLLAVAFLSLRSLAATAPNALRRAGKRLGMWLAIVLLIYLAATGRLGIIVPLAGALIAALLRLAPLLVQLMPLLQRLWRRHVPGTIPPGGHADRTTTETRYLHLELQHSTGEIRGRVLLGPYAGRDLQSLNPTELIALHRECATHDRDSAALLEAYLERVHGPDWRTRAGASDSGSAATSARMTRDEAYEILGLPSGASREAIIQAHRRLMQRVHPDRGGSDYLAAKINRAKDTLLGT